MVWSLRLLFVHCTTPLRAYKELQWLHETTRIHNLQNAWIIRWQKVDVPGSFLERSTFRFIVVSDHSLNLHILGGRLWVPFYCTRCPKLSVCPFRCTKPDKSSWLIICVSISVVNVLGVYWVVHPRKNGAREGDMRGERELPLSSIVSLCASRSQGTTTPPLFQSIQLLQCFPLYLWSSLFFSNSKLQSSFLPQFSKNTLLNTWKVIPIWRRICSK